MQVYQPQSVGTGLRGTDFWGDGGAGLIVL